MSDQRLWCLTHGQYLTECVLAEYLIVDSRGKLTSCRWVEADHE